MDDEKRIRRGIERLVISCGEQFNVLATFANGKEALSFLHNIEGDVDLVITDVKMPEMDGVKFIQEAKKYYEFSPLFISGYDEFEYLHSALREGAVDYLLKPINRQQLRSRMLEIYEMIINKRQASYVIGDMERKAEKLDEFRQAQILRDVTSTDIDLSRLGYWVDEFPEGQYLLMNVSLDRLPVKARSYTDQDWKAYSFALENIIGEIVSSNRSEAISSSWWWRYDGDYWVLLHQAKLSEGELLIEASSRLAEQICASIRQYTPFTISVSQSDVIDDLYLLRNAKQNALNLMNYRLIFGGNQTFNAGSIDLADHAVTNKIKAMHYQMIQRLNKYIHQTELEESLQQVDHIFERIKEIQSPALIQWLLQYLFIQIHSIWMEYAESVNHSKSLEKALYEVRQIANLSQIKINVTSWINDVIRTIKVSRESEHVKPIEQAKAWISAHLNENITVARIADQVHMNPTYFCKFFKIQTGETVLDYITKLRMEKAQLLLSDHNLKLQDISGRLGYKDTKYFSKLFKHWSGQTPSQYRSSIL